MSAKRNTQDSAMPNLQPLLLKTKDVCRLLGVCARTLKRMEERNLIRNVGFLRHKQFDPEEIRRLVEQHRAWKP